MVFFARLHRLAKIDSSWTVPEAVGLERGRGLP